MIAKTALLCALGAMVGCTVDAGEGAGRADVASGWIDPERIALGAPSAGAEALARVDENLERLRALDVFEVGGLLVRLPEEAVSCHGACPGAEPAIRAAEEEAALRLADLAAVAELAAGEPGSYLCTELVDENLDALRALEIVEIHGLVAAAPEGALSGYELPCRQDIAAAKAIHEERAAALDSIARAAQGL